ncbi:hypothetical protein AB3N59_16860 [Leptospira sp. WS92.C1]
MLSFFRLIEEYKEESDPLRKRGLLLSYFCSCDTEDIDSAFQFLSGRKEKAIANEEELVLFVSEYSNQPLWMIASSIKEVGNFSETLALITGNPKKGPLIKIEPVLKEIQKMRFRSDLKKSILFSLWDVLPVPERIFLHQILLGKQNIKIQETILLYMIADLFDLKVGIVLERYNQELPNLKSVSILSLLRKWFSNQKLKRLSPSEILKRIDPSLPKDWKDPDPLFFNSNSFLNQNSTINVFKDQENKQTRGDKNENVLNKNHFFPIPEGILVQAVLNSFGIFIWTKEKFLDSRQISEIYKELFNIKESMILLGWIQNKSDKSRIFKIYDVIQFQDEDLSSRSIDFRKKILDSFFQNFSKIISVIDWISISKETSSDKFLNSILKKNWDVVLFHPEETKFYLLSKPLKIVKAVLLYGRKAMNVEGTFFWELSFGVPTCDATHREHRTEFSESDDATHREHRIEFSESDDATHREHRIEFSESDDATHREHRIEFSESDDATHREHRTEFSESDDATHREHRIEFSESDDATHREHRIEFSESDDATHRGHRTEFSESDDATHREHRIEFSESDDATHREHRIEFSESDDATHREHRIEFSESDDATHRGHRTEFSESDDATHREHRTEFSESDDATHREHRTEFSESDDATHREHRIEFSESDDATGGKMNSSQQISTQDTDLKTIARIQIDSNHSLFSEIDSFFKENTIEKKGPIRGVPTIWKAELSFQNILPSKRHKSGFVLEEVRIHKKISSDEMMDSVDLLLNLLYEM